MTDRRTDRGSGVSASAEPGSRHSAGTIAKRRQAARSKPYAARPAGSPGPLLSASTTLFSKGNFSSPTTGQLPQSKTGSLETEASGLIVPGATALVHRHDAACVHRPANRFIF